MNIPRYWRLQNQRYNLIGEVCEKCGAKLFPPRDVCPECGNPVAASYAFSGQGEIYSYSTVHQAPEGYEEFVPYTVALVKLEEGPLVTAQLTDVDPDEVRIGMAVEMVTRKLREEGKDGLIVYGYKFRPRLKAG
ncbi:MAG: Zn-ribbon domain-containing OB-fold protein [Chloroflexota bacterium]|nr:Zn-ribbon domain-containing OB-fold protein [Chloroflexota bacterium]